MNEEYLTVEQLAARLGWSPKTIHNKMGPRGIFKKGVHYAQAPGLPVLFRWSAVLELYDWTPERSPLADDSSIERINNAIPMARGYSMK